MNVHNISSRTYILDNGKWKQIFWDDGKRTSECDGFINDFDCYLKQKDIKGKKSILKKVELNKN